VTTIKLFSCGNAAISASADYHQEMTQAHQKPESGIPRRHAGAMTRMARQRPSAPQPSSMIVVDSDGRLDGRLAGDRHRPRRPPLHPRRRHIGPNGKPPDEVEKYYIEQRC
jgi:hypothetical protein